jgi:hypothetical protein
MIILNIALTILFSIFSTAILSYISMAVMIGPWIHSIIVIASSLIFSCLRSKLSSEERIQSISLITAGSSIGGILATGCGFAFPTLYFLNKDIFNEWLNAPLYFIAIMALISFSAGALGLLIANTFEHKLIDADKLPFPIGELCYNLVALKDSSQAYQLIAGSISSAMYSVIMCIYSVSQRVVLLSSFDIKGLNIPAIGIPIYELPLLISIGFIAGSLIMTPLVIGLISKIVIINPAHLHFFKYLNYNDFSFAFISGMVFYGALVSLLGLPKFFKGIAKEVKNVCNPDHVSFTSLNTFSYIKWGSVLLITFLFLSWFKFSIPLQVYLIAFTVVCTYQLLVIGGELGIAPVARFATFVMMPALFIFNPDYAQLTLISTFVEVCGGVAVDILFGRKLAQLSGLESKKVESFQWLGLIISALSVGIVFWFLITKFGLGSTSLIAQRGQTRALTIQFQNFDFHAMILGALFGSLLNEFKMNPIMVLGGILMPMEWVLMLIAGGALAAMIKNAKDYQVFWSGVFAVNSIVMIIKAFI